ncbi:MAG TPA: DUF3151 family protein [Ilumatobacteraceae bacterium]|nr:DUF3151 family protein [Ilumatobacteraceae bacterium]
MSDLHVSMTPAGPPRTVLPAEDDALLRRLRDAAGDRSVIAVVVADHPRSLFGWAALGAASTEVIDAYAAFRVGYHRGLDALRANGWRGSGYVRWSDPTNVGFLRCLAGLGRCAEQIGEADEAERIRLFLLQLDPSGTPQQ